MQVRIIETSPLNPIETRYEASLEKLAMVRQAYVAFCNIVDREPGDLADEVIENFTYAKTYASELAYLAVLYKVAAKAARVELDDAKGVRIAAYLMGEDHDKMIRVHILWEPEPQPA